jgi:hypothetical protein
LSLACNQPAVFLARLLICEIPDVSAGVDWGDVAVGAAEGMAVGGMLVAVTWRILKTGEVGVMKSCTVDGYGELDRKVY